LNAYYDKLKEKTLLLGSLEYSLKPLLFVDIKENFLNCQLIIAIFSRFHKIYKPIKIGKIDFSKVRIIFCNNVESQGQKFVGYYFLIKPLQVKKNEIK